jgi:hypothetical protein
MKQGLIFLCVAALVLCSAPAFSITISPYDSATNMAQALVGTGITISNITYTGVTVASGYFTDGLAAGIGINQGIVLTSGFVSNIDSLNNSDSITGNNGLPGDSDLAKLVPGYTTYDATVLEFDFVSAGTEAYFNYVFGSDEYNEYANTSFNDVFGFFCDVNQDGTNQASENVALIPGTTIPVSINTVNGGNPYGTNPKNPVYYNNNDLNDGGPFFAFEYDGFTDPFTAAITGLTAGSTYHLKLAIADSGDRILDSGVFLQGGSFSEEPVPIEPIPEPATVLLLSSGLIGLAGFRKRFKRG